MTDSYRNTTKKNNKTNHTAVRAVFFDVGNTILRAKPSVAEIYHTTASRYGISPPIDDIEHSFKKRWQESKESEDFIRESAGQGQLVEKMWWREFVRSVFEDFDPIDDFEGFFGELYDIFARPESWELFPEVHEVLSSLGTRGYRLGVISNWDSRLPAILHGLDVDKYFQEIFISSLVGREKPDKRIFQLASDQMTVHIEECIHIGDDPVLDYEGARVAGMSAYLLDRDGNNNCVEKRTIASLRELLIELQGLPAYG